MKNAKNSEKLLKNNSNLKNDKYFYSEEQDKIIVNDILEDLNNRSKERKQHELCWELNMNFMLGNHKM